MYLVDLIIFCFLVLLVLDAIMFYLLLDIRQAGITSELGQLSALIILGVVKLAFVFVGAHLFDRLGRRPLLFVSLIGTYHGISTVDFLIFVVFSRSRHHSYSSNPTFAYCFRIISRLLRIARRC